MIQLSQLNRAALWEVLTDTVLDLIKLLPFLFVTYLFMEFLEHKTKRNRMQFISFCRKFGPIAGAFAGIFPQCGFSASAAGLYSGGILSMGTLVAVFLSTSDEMIPILISHLTPISQIFKILGLKLVCATVAGFVLDLCLKGIKKQKIQKSIETLCDKQHCDCHKKGVFTSALRHTLEIILFVGAFSLLLNVGILLIGEETLSSFLTSSAVLGPLISCLVGLIPNCASSVLITQLWLKGVFSTGSLVGGLLTGSGIGILVLFKTNRPTRENFFVLGYVYLAGALCGIALDLFHIIL